MLTLYPGRSLVQNIGNDQSGTHAGRYKIFDVPIQKLPVQVLDVEVKPSAEGYDAFVDFFKKTDKLFQKVGS